MYFLGIMGSGMVKNLLNSGHNVTVWNRTTEKVSPHSFYVDNGEVTKLFVLSKFENVSLLTNFVMFYIIYSSSCATTSDFL